MEEELYEFNDGFFNSIDRTCFGRYSFHENKGIRTVSFRSGTLVFIWFLDILPRGHRSPGRIPNACGNLVNVPFDNTYGYNDVCKGACRTVENNSNCTYRDNWYNDPYNDNRSGCVWKRNSNNSNSTTNWWNCSSNSHE